MIAIVLVLTIWSHLSGVSQGQLSVSFYDDSCPNVGAIVGGVIRDVAASNANIAPVLLRLHFHDCFVQGCDGSILVDNGEISERHAFGHQGVGGFEVIEKAKAEVEAVCPGIVSCADIVALAAREAVVLANGPSYGVEMGRRDGMVSNLSLADDMPDIDDSIQTLKNKFINKGLSENDLVVLSAAHTIGTTACFFMTNRLYNFPGVGGSDPSISPELLPELKATCPQNGDVNVRLPIDHGSGQTFDSQILQNIRSGFAVLQSDARLYEDDVTRNAVDSYFGGLPFLRPSFEDDFADAMVKMGRIGVLSGSQGKIRRSCAAFN
ncbi:PREDICTED: peroxidase 43 [Ipomoea nil]|uniref:peroxidase 43 n=1 Tax=Ipomoea nil TaxID=35883 RepID=UPI000901A423|nr:PREDICTED: peroxidase 43 [Ipomoea nil]